MIEFPWQVLLCRSVYGTRTLGKEITFNVKSLEVICDLSLRALRIVGKNERNRLLISTWNRFEIEPSEIVSYFMYSVVIKPRYWTYYLWSVIALFSTRDYAYIRDYASTYYCVELNCCQLSTFQIFHYHFCI